MPCAVLCILCILSVVSVLSLFCALEPSPVSTVDVAMKYVSCTPEKPLAIYDDDTLRDLGKECVDRLKLLDRADVIHLLSYLAPFLDRRDTMTPELLHNRLLVAGFEYATESSYIDAIATPIQKSSAHQTLSVRGVMPSKAFPPLPMEIVCRITKDKWLIMESMRFRID